jgi:hypothetical protein
MKKISSFKKAILLVTLVLLGLTNSANALVTIKVGSAADVSASNADFSTITAAYASIPATVTDAYLIELQDGYDPTTETYPIALAAKTGASSTNSITIKPNATNSNPITIAAPKISVDNLLTTSATYFLANGATKLITASTTGLAANQYIYGYGIPASTQLSSITSNSNITLNTASNAASSTAFSSIVSPADISANIKTATSTAVSTNTTLKVASISASGIAVNQFVCGVGVTPGTYVTAINADNITVTVSANLNIANGVSLTFVAAPVSVATTAASSSSTTLKIPTGSLSAGMYIFGTGIAAGTKISTIVDASTVTLSANATVGNGVSVNSGVFMPTWAPMIDLQSVTGLSVGNFVMISGVNTPSLTIVDISGNTIGFSPAATISSGATLYSGPGTRNYTFNITGSYITIDGGDKSKLIIKNPNRSVSNAIALAGTYNTIKNCTVQGACQQSTSGTSYNGSIYVSNTNNSILNCDIRDIDTDNAVAAKMPAVGINVNNSNTVVTNCNIYNFQPNIASQTSAAVYVQGGSNTTVRNNRVYWTNSMAIPYTNNFNPIAFGSGSSGTNPVTDNIIDGAIAGGANTFVTSNGGIAAFTFYGIAGKNLYIKNNIIRNISGACNTFYAIQAKQMTIANPADSICNGNTVTNISLTPSAASTFYGIQYDASSTTSIKVKDNTISAITLAPTSAVAATINGIVSTGTASTTLYDNFSGNKVYGLTAGSTSFAAANTINAMSLAANTGVVEKNLIYNLSVPGGTNASLIYGIKTAGGNAITAQTYNTLSITGTLLKNNIVRLGTDVSNDVSIYGIYQGALTAATNAYATYNNSICIGGTAPNTASKNTFGFYTAQTTTVTGSNIVKNNIFANQRGFDTGGAPTSVNYAVAIPTATASVVTASDNNLYYSSTVGLLNTTAKTTLDDWKNTVASGSDAASLSADPGFADATASTPDMHLSASSQANQSGALIASVTDDFAGAIRADYTPNDMGAYAIAGSTSVTTSKSTDLKVYVANNSIVFESLNGLIASVYTISGQKLKTIALKSDKVAVPCSKGFYIVSVGEKNTKLMVN